MPIADDMTINSINICSVSSLRTSLGVRDMGSGKKCKTQTAQPGLRPRFMPWLLIDKAAKTSVSGPIVQQGSALGLEGIQSNSGSLIKISSPPSARRRSGGGPAAVCLGHGSVAKHPQILSCVTSSQLVILLPQNSVRSSD